MLGDDDYRHHPYWGGRRNRSCGEKMNTVEVSIIAGLALTIVGFLAIWKLEIVSYVYDVRLTANGIEFCLFRIWIVHRLPYSGIESVDIQRGWRGGLFTYNFKNRLFRTTFLIRKRKGWFTRRILVTPANESEFLRALANAHVPVAGATESGAPKPRSARS